MPDARLAEIGEASAADANPTRSPLPATRRWSFIVFAVLSAVLLISRFHHPEDAPAHTLCAFKTIVGLPCPACGMTRSFCAAAKGQPARAFAFNLLGPPLFLFAFSVWGLALSASINRPAPLSYVLGLMADSRFIKPALFALLVYWGFRIIYTLAVDGFAASVGRGLLFRIWQ